MRARAAICSAFACGLGCVLAAASCSYDWSIAREAPVGDASSDVMTQPDVETTDAAPLDGPAKDVAPVEVGAADSSGPTDGGPSCVSLALDVQQAEGPAMACTLGSTTACKSSVPGPCNCKLWVGDDSAAATQLTNAVNAFAAAGCSPEAQGLCPKSCSTMMTTSVCLAAEGGASYACYQQP